jgi:excisionase family DNA binding protein
MQHLLTTEQAAELLGVSAGFLARDRWAGAKIPFIKVGARAVRYDAEVIREYLRKQTRNPARESTSEALP